MLLLLACAGCGGEKLHEAQGTITLDGQPLADAAVTFIPLDGPAKSAVGQTDASGHYQMRTSDAAGAIRGEYKVVVTKDDLPPVDPNWTPQQKMDARMKASKKPRKSLVPKEYTDAATTPLRCKVPPAENEGNLELKSR